MGLTIAVGATACRPATNPNTSDDPNHTVTGPSGNGNGGSGSTTDPTDPYSQYSQILQNVLKKSYYINLIDKYKNSDKFVYGKLYTRNDNYLNNVPYGFFENKGFDVEKIKQEQLKTFAHCYIKDSEPNNLYIATNVETKTANSDYYTNYLLKYSITDDEIKDLEMLYDEDYIQANFFIQELSYVKTPTVVSEFKIDVATYDGMLAEMNQTTNVKNGLYPNYISIFNPSDYSVLDDDSCKFSNFNLVSTTSKNVAKGTTGTANMIITNNSGWKFSNDIFKMNYPDRIVVSSAENIRKNLTEVTIYKMADGLTHLNFE